MYFWVNQGKTYKEEKEGGYIWAPLKDQSGKTPYHWKTMEEVQVNDIVFNYRDGQLVGYCEIQSEAYHAPLPKEFNVDVEWENEGFMADAVYYTFESPLPLKTLFPKIKDTLPEKYSPVVSSGEKANQGYLYKLEDDTGNKIKELANLNIDTPTRKLRKNTPLKDDYKRPDKTSRKGLVTSRVGQGEYRRRVLHRWNYQCAVTGADLSEILIASHIIPWRDSTDEQKLDIDNGILLSPVYDALFDKHYISFTDEGDIIFGKSVDILELRKLGVTGEESIEGLNEGNKRYLVEHRKKLM